MPVLRRGSPTGEYTGFGDQPGHGDVMVLGGNRGAHELFPAHHSHGTMIEGQKAVIVSTAPAQSVALPVTAQAGEYGKIHLISLKSGQPRPGLQQVEGPQLQILQRC